MLRLCLAMLLVLGSGAFLFFLLAFSTMLIGPMPEAGLPRLLAVLGRMFLSYSPGLGAWPALGLLLTGLYFCFRNLKSLWSRKASRLDPGVGNKSS